MLPQPPEWTLLINSAFTVFNNNHFLEAVNYEKPSEDQRFSAVFCIMVDGSQPIEPQRAKAVLGLPAFSLLPGEKRSRYLTLCEEKALRTATSQHGIVSSAQTRDPAKNRFTGGIRAGRFALGSSGLPEEWDEILDVCIGRINRLLTADQATEIMTISGSIKHFKQHNLEFKIPGL